VDHAGRPWLAPVYFAADAYRRFFWISSPRVTHSRNLAEHPQVSIVVFDSQVPAYAGQAVYTAATAAEVDHTDLERSKHAHTA
jgi:hypothetical protein